MLIGCFQIRLRRIKTAAILAQKCFCLSPPQGKENPSHPLCGWSLTRGFIKRQNWSLLAVFETIYFSIDDKILTTFLNRLQEIFTAMDREYSRAAGRYQFQCEGCRDNCCLTRFYHHTYLEYFYLHRSFEKLEPHQKREIIARAENVNWETDQADRKELPTRLMCPLNADGLCHLYPYRPMICRMHGIPHELKKPGREVIHGPGCSTFDERCADKDYVAFDRTPFYVAMAKLENEFKQAAGLEGRIKMTVAEMILSIAKNSEDR